MQRAPAELGEEPILPLGALVPLWEEWGGPPAEGQDGRLPLGKHSEPLVPGGRVPGPHCKGRAVVGGL